MKIKKSGGYIAHQQLEFSFTMLQLGGSPTQYYNTVDKVYEPDRSLAPYVLKPSLQIYDPENKLPAGEYSSEMTNVIWSLTIFSNGNKMSLAAGKDYSVGDDKALTLSRNVAENESLQISFCADYLDWFRNQTSHFNWDITLTTIARTDYNFEIRIDAPSKLNLSPFKNRGQFKITTQAVNGRDIIQDADVDYLWEMYDYTTEAFISITEDEFWCISGNTSNAITIDQAYVNKVLLRVTAILKSNTSVRDVKTVLLRRYYGAYESSVDFLSGKYLFKDSEMIYIEANVYNRQGIISNPTRFFDMELLFHNNPSSLWQSLGYGEYANAHRDGDTYDHEAGIILRELSALMPISLSDGSVLSINGSCLVGQFPKGERELE